MCPPFLWVRTVSVYSLLLWSTALKAPTIAPTGPATIPPIIPRDTTLALFTVPAIRDLWLEANDEYELYEGREEICELVVDKRGVVELELLILL